MSLCGQKSMYVIRNESLLMELKSIVLFCHVIFRMSSRSSLEFSAQGQVLHCKRRNLGWSSAEHSSSTANSETKSAVLPGTE